MAANYDINAPSGIKNFCKVDIRFKTDMGKKNCEIDIFGSVTVADSSDFPCGFVNVYERTDEFISLCGMENFFGKKTDEKNFHSADFFDDVGFEKADAISGDVHIGVDYRELCAFFNKEKMRKTVVNFVVAKGNNVRGEHVHNFNGGHAFIFAVDYASAEHIAGNGIKYVFFLMSNFVYVTGKHRNSAQEFLIDFFCHKVAVKVV